MNKRKIFNDPIYGLIRFRYDILYMIIDHPYFQRLRRISQQALSHYVYPGALHTRFQHALGALHLMTRALETIIAKGVEISEQEYESACIAILLHDVGHGPFSHALEHALADVHHEDISLVMIQKISDELGSDFSLALNIFTGKYRRPFLHQLVTGQIDVDRMDYLTRDSFFSGVAEGIIGYDRIITMMNVVDDQLVIEEKGIYSIEKFLMARRLMYWQVYLHKTVISAEVMLISILKRARHLTLHGVSLPVSEELHYFLSSTAGNDRKISDPDFIRNFVLLDDMDILWMIKKSVHHEDMIFRYLCSSLLERRLLKVSVSNPANLEVYHKHKNMFMHKHALSEEDISYFFSIKKETITQYDTKAGEISILTKSGQVAPYSHFNPGMMQMQEERSFLFFPKPN